MRQALAAALVLFSSFCFGQSAGSQSASPQTARQALLEMFFGEKPNHLEKHLPDVTRHSLGKLSSPDSPSVLAEFSMIATQLRAQGTDFQTFEAGPILLSTADWRNTGTGRNGPDKIELSLERDDLVGDEDQIELAFHMYKNGKEESLPVVPRFTFSMESESDVWRLNEITVTVRVPLADPTFLKTMEDQQRSRNEQMVSFALHQVNTAEKAYSVVQGHFACSLAALGPRSAQGQPPTNAYLWDPQLVSGEKFSYVFVISGCDSGHYKVVAEPAVDDSGQRAFCSDEGGSIRAAADGKATTCLSNGEVVHEAMVERATGVAVVVPGPSQATGMAAATAGTVGASSDVRAQKGVQAVPAQGQGQLVRMTPDLADERPMPTGTPQRIRISSAVMQGLLMTKVEATYPDAAKTSRTQGSVVLAALVGKDGRVQSLRVVNSASPLLNQAALDGVKQWKYRPYILNGTPVEVETTITINFTLGR